MIALILLKIHFHPQVRFNKIKCETSNKSVTIIECRIKAYSRAYATFIITANLSKKIDDLRVRILTLILNDLNFI